MKKIILSMIVMFIIFSSFTFALSEKLSSGWELNDNGLDVLGLSDLTNIGFIYNSTYNFLGSYYAECTGATNSDARYPTTNINGNNAFSEYTISFWTYPKSTSTGATDCIFNSYGNNGYIRICTKDNKFYFEQYDGGDWKIVQDSGNYNLNTWYHVVGRWNKTHIDLFVNDTLKASLPAPVLASNPGGTNYLCYSTYASNYNGKVDSVMIFNNSLTNSEIDSLYNNGLGIEYPFFSDVAPIINFINQTPSDINITGLFYENLTIYYNITDDLGVSGVNFSYNINNSVGDIPIFINGTIQQLGFNQKETYTNLSNIYKFTLNDNRIYPASYNIDEEVTNSEKKSELLIDTSNDYAKIEILNITSQWNYYLAEIYINNSVDSIGASQIYICNSSYTTGTPSTTSDCILARTITADTPYDHVHSSVSKHYVIPFTKNVMRSPKYIVIRGDSNSNFYLNYVTNGSRSTTMQISNNAGSSYSSVSGTPDAHIHFYNGTETFCYFVSANDTLDQRTNSVVRCDNLDITNLPPTPAIVLNPTNQIYSGIININWTNATPFFNSYITGYNISLHYENETFISLLSTQTGLNYSWNSGSISEGNYTIKVTSNDNNSLSSFSFSEIFEIDNSKPSITANTPADLFLNTSTGYINENYNFNIDFIDGNLYITEFIIRMENGTVLYNDTVIRSTTTESYNLADSLLIPNMTLIANDTLYGYAKAIDGHTAIDVQAELQTDILKVSENKIISDCFDYELLDDTKSLKVNYLTDRVTYVADYVINSNMKRIKVTPRSCGKGKIIYSDEYKDYLIIDKYWIDFNGEDVSTVRITDNGAYYLIEQYLKSDKTLIETKSIGIVNTYNVDFKINVASRIYVEPPLSLTNFDLENQTNVLILFIMAILWLGVNFMAYTFKNFGFASFGFFIGIAMGLLLFQLSIFLTLMFLLLNVVLYINFAKGKR